MDWSIVVVSSTVRASTLSSQQELNRISQMWLPEQPNCEMMADGQHVMAKIRKLSQRNWYRRRCSFVHFFYLLMFRWATLQSLSQNISCCTSIIVIKIIATLIIAVGLRLPGWQWWVESIALWTVPRTVLSDIVSFPRPFLLAVDIRPLSDERCDYQDKITN